MAGRKAPGVTQRACGIDRETRNHQFTHTILRPLYNFHVVPDRVIGVVELRHGRDFRVQVAAVPIFQLNLLPACRKAHAVGQIAGLYRHESRKRCGVDGHVAGPRNSRNVKDRARLDGNLNNDGGGSILAGSFAQLQDGGAKFHPKLAGRKVNRPHLLVLEDFDGETRESLPDEVAHAIVQLP